MSPQSSLLNLDLDQFGYLDIRMFCCLTIYVKIEELLLWKLLLYKVQFRRSCHGIFKTVMWTWQILMIFIKFRENISGENLNGSLDTVKINQFYYKKIQLMQNASDLHSAKVSVFRVFLARIFQHSDWMRTLRTSYLSTLIFWIYKIDIKHNSYWVKL